MNASQNGPLGNGSPRRERRNFTAQQKVTIVVSIFTAFITAIVSESMGWVQRTYNDDPGNGPLILWVFLFSVGLLIIKASLSGPSLDQTDN